MGVGEQWEVEIMPYILAFAFFLACMIADRFTTKRAPGNLFEPASNANAGLKATTGELAFGEHWQAWADAIRREAVEPSEEQGEIAMEYFPAA